VYFELSVRIQRPPHDVFRFLRDKDRYPQETGSPVLVLDKITAGDTRVGTRYREVVQMAPLLRGEFFSAITRYEPPHFLEEDFEGASMRGHLAYEFAPDSGGTLLIQRETLDIFGPLWILSPMVRYMLARQLRKRLNEIRDVLDSGWEVGSFS
jgi:uncharacterized protein YndB with AHSA1/START domain